jgi:hypothetical protein
MPHIKRTLPLIGVLFSLLWSTACSPAAPTSTPTLDLNPLRTQVAGTVFAQVTRDLALTPSATPLPPPTATSLPSSTPSLTASPAPSAAVTLSSGTPQAATANQDQWVSQSIADDTIFAPGQTFTMTWRLKNTGTSTWTAGYLLRYYSGNAFGAPKEIAIGQQVLPGGEIDINVNMKAPANPGSYRTDWVMSNETRTNFKEPVFLKIKVAIPGTATPTAKL